LAKREKTVTRSYRISESAIQALSQEAERRNVSVNTLLNQLLLTFSEHDRFMSELRMVKLSSQTFRRLLQTSTDEGVAEAARSAGANTPEAFALSKFGEVSAEGILDYLKAMGRYGDLFEFNLVQKPGSRTLTLVHNLGARGSIFLSEYAKAAFEPAGTKTRVTHGDDFVTLVLLSRE
jgi:histone H3/H4